MQPEYLMRYLHEHIPLSSAMQVEVLSIGSEGVVLRAPLAPNINHRDTVFGGSASALAILSAWSLVHVGLAQVGTFRIVIQRNSIEYTAPMPGDFSARSFVGDPAAWARFVLTLERRGRARVTVSCVLQSEGAECGRFEGVFVAIDTER
jgi:thioesterase domain-containing protein